MNLWFHIPAIEMADVLATYNDKEPMVCSAKSTRRKAMGHPKPALTRAEWEWHQPSTAQKYFRYLFIIRDRIHRMSSAWNPDINGRGTEKPNPAKPKGGNAVVVGASLIAAVKMAQDRSSRFSGTLAHDHCHDFNGAHHREEDLRQSGWRISRVVLRKRKLSPSLNGAVRPVPRNVVAFALCA
jgi:hypothetical protein